MDTWIEIAALFLASSIFGMYLERFLADRYLHLKAKDDTPLCVDGKFYYVVPESEYVELLLARHKTLPEQIAEELAELKSNPQPIPDALSLEIQDYKTTMDFVGGVTDEMKGNTKP